MDVQVIKIMPGIFKMRLPMPYSLDQVNTYILETDPLTLIDTGPIMPGVEEALERAMARSGHHPSQLGRIVVTHTHVDHMGLAARLKAASGAEVICHRHALEEMTNHREYNLREMEYLIAMSRTVGLSPELMEANRHFMERWLDVAESVQVDRCVEGGEVLEGDPYDLEVIYTPGHSFDHIVLYLRELGLVFTGDFLLDKITPNPDIYPPWKSQRISGLPDYLDSVMSLKELKVIQALPGHGRCISNFRGRLGEVLEHHEQRKRYIVANLRGREMNVLELALDLIRFVEAEMNTTNIFLAIREILGHMVILEDEGKVFRETREGTFYYKVT